MPRQIASSLTRTIVRSDHRLGLLAARSLHLRTKRLAVTSASRSPRLGRQLSARLKGRCRLFNRA